MTHKVRDWERSNQKVLSGLGYLLNQIIEAVKGSASQIAIVSYDGGMKLEVIASEQKAAPSEALDAEWPGGKQGTEGNKLMVKCKVSNASMLVMSMFLISFIDACPKHYITCKDTNHNWRFTI